MPGEQGKAILNATWIQWALQKDAAEQQGGEPEEDPFGGDARGPAPDEEEPDDSLLHQDDKAPPWAAQGDGDEDDDQLLSKQTRKSARDIARFAADELRKARITRVVRDGEQTIIVED